MEHIESFYSLCPVSNSLENEIKELRKQMTTPMDESNLIEKQTSPAKEEDLRLEGLEKKLTRSQKKLKEKRKFLTTHLLCI